MTVTIRYFAMLREQAGCDSEERTTAATTPSALYAELAAAHRFTMPLENLRVAVNDALVTMETTLRDGDEITFIPPVAGG